MSSQPSTSWSRACAGWSTAATTPPGWRCVGDGKLAAEKRAGKLANLEALPSSSIRCRHADDRHRAHPLGHPRRAQRPQRAPARRLHRPVAVIHNGIIENFAALRAELEDARARAASDTDTEVVAHLLADELPTVGRRPRRGDARGVPPAARARSRWSPCTPTRPTSSSAPGATRRWWSAAATARTSSPPTSRRSSRTPARRSSSARTRSSSCAATASTVTDFDGDPADGTRVPRRLGRLGRREGRLRLLHAQGDRRAAEGRRRHAARPASTTTAGCVLDEMRLSRRRAARGRQDRRRRVRHGVPRRAGREVRHRALDPDPVRGRARREFRYRDPIARPARRWSSRSRSPARRWTR